jgi:RimJ/RimL family protein N-acetyltransferase
VNLEEKESVSRGDLSLRTERLCLRKLTNSDAAALFAYRSLPEIYAYQSRTTTLSDAAAFISGTADELDQPGTWYQLGIFRTGDPALIGDIGIHFLNTDTGQVELGFTLAPAFQGQGYATEAVSAVLSYLFIYLKKRRIIITVDPRNTRCRLLAARLGMVQTACYDKQIPSSGDVCSDITYTVNADDWRANPPAPHGGKVKLTLD